MTASKSGYLDAALEHLRANQPRLTTALVADAKAAATERGERSKFRSRADVVRQVLRLALECDGFLGLCLYRIQSRLDARGRRRAANVLRRIAVIAANVSIGRTVLVHPGVFLAHGNVVIDGLVEIGAGTVIMPGVTIGLREGPRSGGLRGPTIGKDVEIGTGAKILGPITLHRGARIGANAVVLQDVPAGATAIGIPATILRQGADIGSLR